MFNLKSMFNEASRVSGILFTIGKTLNNSKNKKSTTRHSPTMDDQKSLVYSYEGVLDLFNPLFL